MRGDPAPRRGTRQGVASVVGGGPDGGRIAGNVSAKWSKGTGGPAGDEAYNLIAFDALACGDTGHAVGEVPGALHGGGKHGGRAAVAFQERSVATDWAVRRLTPRECERLQGFPDDYTLVSMRGRPAADGPRYKAVGNSMAVNAMQWIGERIAFVDGILEAERGTGGVWSVR